MNIVINYWRIFSKTSRARYLPISGVDYKFVKKRRGPAISPASVIFSPTAIRPLKATAAPRPPGKISRFLTDDEYFMSQLFGLFSTAFSPFSFLASARNFLFMDAIILDACFRPLFL